MIEADIPNGEIDPESNHERNNLLLFLIWPVR